MSYGLTLDSMGLVAGSLRHFKVPDIINEAIHKKAHNSGIDYGSLVVAMLLQLTYVPYQGLWNLNEFHEDSPLFLLLGSTSLALSDYTLQLQLKSCLS